MKLPENSKFLNFESYLKNMDTELIVKSLYQFSRPGRPSWPFNESKRALDDKTVTD